MVTQPIIGQRLPEYVKKYQGGGAGLVNIVKILQYLNLYKKGLYLKMAEFSFRVFFFYEINPLQGEEFKGGVTS